MSLPGMAGSDIAEQHAGTVLMGIPLAIGLVLLLIGLIFWAASDKTMYFGIALGVVGAAVSGWAMWSASMSERAINLRNA